MYITRYALGYGAALDVAYDLDAHALRFTPVRQVGAHEPSRALRPMVIGMPHAGPWRDAPKEIARLLRLYRDEVACEATRLGLPA